jgi:hypothetical protein
LNARRDGRPNAATIGCLVCGTSRARPIESSCPIRPLGGAANDFFRRWCSPSRTDLQSEHFAAASVCPDSCVEAHVSKVKYGAAISPQQHGEEGSMPFYHFDLINTKTVADKGEAELPDDIEAMDSADELARRLLDEHPDLRNRHYAVLVTNDDGEEICRVPLDIIH